MIITGNLKWWTWETHRFSSKYSTFKNNSKVRKNLKFIHGPYNYKEKEKGNPRLQSWQLNEHVNINALVLGLGQLGVWYGMKDRQDGNLEQDHFSRWKELDCMGLAFLKSLSIGLSFGMAKLGVSAYICFNQ